MLDFYKVKQLLTKEFPDITQEEIDEMISQIPPSMPYAAVKSLIKITKHLKDNPAKMKLLKLQTAKKTETE